jgi:hypothetical protein
MSPTGASTPCGEEATGRQASINMGRGVRRETFYPPRRIPVPPASVPSISQRPLSEIRDAFWNTPRLPLLYDGERDLQQAVYDAVRKGQLCIVDALGNTVAVTEPAIVNLSSIGLRLAATVLVPSTPVVDGGGGASGTGLSTVPRDGDQEGQRTGERQDLTVVVDRPLAAEKYIAFPLVGGLMDNPGRSDLLAQVFRTLYSILDEHKASYAQGTLQFVMDARSADRLAEQVRALGVNVNLRDQ